MATDRKGGATRILIWLWTACVLAFLYVPMIAVVLASAIGIVDELIQLIIPSRVFDPIDIGFNVFAAVMGVAVSSAIAWATRPRTSSG